MNEHLKIYSDLTWYARTSMERWTRDAYSYNFKFVSVRRFVSIIVRWLFTYDRTSAISRKVESYKNIQLQQPVTLLSAFNRFHIWTLPLFQNFSFVAFNPNVSSPFNVSIVLTFNYLNSVLFNKCYLTLQSVCVSVRTKTTLNLLKQRVLFLMTMPRYMR